MTSIGSKALAWPLIQLVRLYRVAISPWLGLNCRFDPSCSSYTIEALRVHGILKGTALAVRRIGSCHPWGRSGYDPVPPPNREDSERE